MPAASPKASSPEATATRAVIDVTPIMLKKTFSNVLSSSPITKSLNEAIKAKPVRNAAREKKIIQPPLFVMSYASHHRIHIHKLSAVCHVPNERDCRSFYELVNAYPR